jgi:hypothetical protein
VAFFKKRNKENKMLVKVEPGTWLGIIEYLQSLDILKIKDDKNKKKRRSQTYGIKEHPKIKKRKSKKKFGEFTSQQVEWGVSCYVVRKKDTAA